ncbi:MAG: type II secretion system protein N [Betaproteobacteria bacterium]|nr:type II secretion system protein N [Betaproteobacteria bacterium]
MKSRWALGVLGTLLLLAALGSQAPAWLVARALAEHAAGRLVLEQATGTLWSGHGRLLITTAGGPVVLAEHLAWQLSPLALLGGQAKLDLEFEGVKSGQIEIAHQRIAARALRFTIPAAALAILPQLEKARPVGSLLIDLPELDWRRENSSGRGRIQWRDAGLQLAGAAARWRGEVRVEISAQDDLLLLQTSTGAPLPLRLELRHTAQGLSTRLAAPGQ